MISKAEVKSSDLVGVFQDLLVWNLNRVKFFVLFIWSLCKVQSTGFDKLPTAFD
jgi:hypothetical protein